MQNCLKACGVRNPACSTTVAVHASRSTRPCSVRRTVWKLAM
jgi:hypothetical protein